MKHRLSYFDIILRYGLILIFGITNLSIFYAIFTWPTIKLSSFLLSLVSSTIAFDNIIIFNSHVVYIIEACIAGSAYYLLWILILSSANIDFFKRVYVILFSFTSLFLFNVLRIFLLILVTGTAYFDYFHMFFWYVLSTAFVLLLWLACVKIFKLKSIPVYSDIKEILKLYKNKR